MDNFISFNTFHSKIISTDITTGVYNHNFFAIVFQHNRPVKSVKYLQLHIHILHNRTSNKKVDLEEFNQTELQLFASEHNIPVYIHNNNDQLRELIYSNLLMEQSK
eukprot:Phypoly_transcript_07047.p2 GENE.Phypoly_transcript_07047~~Phypoly_transcript_07047.p2  ORF type:complete len:106 (-),score=3.33 Phypoly_transcript_07047:351-668(-)